MVSQIRMCCIWEFNCEVERESRESRGIIQNHAVTLFATALLGIRLTTEFSLMEFPHKEMTCLTYWKLQSDFQPVNDSLCGIGLCWTGAAFFHTELTLLCGAVSQAQVYSKIMPSRVQDKTRLKEVVETKDRTNQVHFRRNRRRMSNKHRFPDEKMQWLESFLRIYRGIDLCAAALLHTTNQCIEDNPFFLRWNL